LVQLGAGWQDVRAALSADSARRSDFEGELEGVVLEVVEAGVQHHVCRPRQCASINESVCYDSL
jgi:hypothetical protein